ncbi:hypothetical protein MIDIC_230045 [Alphaproteobacteria bacterium]
MTEQAIQKQLKYLEPVLDAITGALTIDGAIALATGGGYWLVAKAVAGATVGLTVRKYCNAYIGEENSWRPLICGGLGGALKYSIKKSTLDPFNMFLGTINGALFESEQIGPVRACKDKGAGCVLKHIVLIETSEGVLKFFQNIVHGAVLLENIADGFKAGIRITVAKLSVFDHFSEDVKAVFLPGFEVLEEYVIEPIIDLWSYIHSDTNHAEL